MSCSNIAYDALRGKRQKCWRPSRPNGRRRLQRQKCQSAGSWGDLRLLGFLNKVVAARAFLGEPRTRAGQRRSTKTRTSASSMGYPLDRQSYSPLNRKGPRPWTHFTKNHSPARHSECAVRLKFSNALLTSQPPLANCWAIVCCVAASASGFWIFWTIFP